MASRLSGAAGVLVAVAAVAGCSASGSGEAPPPTTAGASGPSRAGASAGAPTSATLGQVTGDLDRAGRAGARDAVEEVVDRWFSAAYRGGARPPTGAGDAFPGFSAGAAAQARDDRALMTNVALAPRFDEVVQRRGDVVVDLLATGGRAQAATARFVLVMALAGDDDRVEQVSGRLYLTRDAPGWQVIGYDVERGRRP